jgi:hypothetical protein
LDKSVNDADSLNLLQSIGERLANRNARQHAVHSGWRILPPKDIALTQDEIFTGGLCLQTRLNMGAKAIARLTQVAQDLETARQEYQRLTGQRKIVTQSLRAIGHSYHFVDVECDVQHNGKLIAGDMQHHIDTSAPLPSENTSRVESGCIGEVNV